MDDAKKQQIMFAIIGFNLTIIVYQIFFNMGDKFSVLRLLLGIVIAAVAGGIGFGVAKFMQR